MSSLHDVLNAGGQDSKEHKALVRAVEKAAGNLDEAKHLVARLYRMPFEVLPSAIRSAVFRLLAERNHVRRTAVGPGGE